MINATERGTKDVLKMTLGQIAITMVSLVSATLIPRVLQPQDFGLLATTLSVVALVHNLTGLSLPSVGIRFMGPAWINKQSQAVEHIAGSLWSWVLLTSFVAAIIISIWIRATDYLDFSWGLCLVISAFCFAKSGFTKIKALLIPVGKVGTQVILELVRAGSHVGLVITCYLLFDIQSVFVALALAALLIFAISARIFKNRVHVRFNWSDLPNMKPYWRYCLLTYLGGLGTSIQVYLSVYLVALVTTMREAACMAIAMQALAILKNLTSAALGVLMPIFADFDQSHQEGRFLFWGGFALRASTAALCITLIGWVLLGRHFINIILTDQYSDAYGMVTLAIINLLVYNIGLSHNRLTNIKGFAGQALVADLIQLGVTAAIYAWVILSRPAFATVYALLLTNIAAATLFAISGILIFRRVSKQSLALWPTLALVAPLPISFWLAKLHLPLLQAVMIGAVVGIAYGAYALIFIKPFELRNLIGSLRHS